jgi:CRP-like cAMP-binding protein
MLKRSLVLAGATALASSLLGAPIAADVIAYRTEDGVFAYTDDHDKVPARYAADAVTVRDAKLHSYPRLTVEDTAAARAVSSRLEKRLDYLRQANAASAAEREVAAKAGTPQQQSNVVTIPTASGSASSPSIEVAANPADGPLVVEQIRTKDGARAATRGTTLVTQGDKVVAVIKNRAHHIDVNSDIHDEATLEGR